MILAPVPFFKRGMIPQFTQDVEQGSLSLTRITDNLIDHDENKIEKTRTAAIRDVAGTLRLR